MSGVKRLVLTNRKGLQAHTNADLKKFGIGSAKDDVANVQSGMINKRGATKK